MPKKTHSPLFYLFAKISSAPIALLIIDQIIFRTELYDSHTWLDIPMHFAGGMAIAWGWMNILKYTKIVQPRFMLIITTVGVTMLAATFWEFFEFIHDQLNQSQQLQPSIADTMFDYFNAIIGSLFVALMDVFRYNRPISK